MSYLNEDIAIKTLSVPSVTRCEQIMRDYLIAFAENLKMAYEAEKFIDIDEGMVESLEKE